MGKQGQSCTDPVGPEESTPTHLPMAPRPEEDEKSISSKASTKDSTSSLNLNTFLANYTSEDNQSFMEILEQSDKKHKIKVCKIDLKCTM
jgi:protein DGCR14